MTMTLQQRLTEKLEQEQKILLKKEQEMEQIHQRIKQKQTQLTNELEHLDDSVNNTIKKFTNLNQAQLQLQGEVHQVLTEIQAQKRQLQTSQNQISTFTVEMEQTFGQIKQAIEHYTHIQTDTQSMLETFQSEKRKIYYVTGFIVVVILLCLLLIVTTLISLWMSILLLLVIVAFGFLTHRYFNTMD